MIPRKAPSLYARRLAALRIYDAAGVQPDRLPDDARATVEWLVSWDDFVTDGVVMLVRAAREAER